MQNLQKRFSQFHKTYLPVIGVLFLMLLAVFLVWFSHANSMQAENATVAQIYFEGEYRIADGDWKPIEKGAHIPATEGDVALRGNFHLLSPGGEYIGLFRGREHVAFYTNHISLTFLEGGHSYTIDHENPLFGDSACGVDWTPHAFTSAGAEPIEILIHNPHAFGNETAVDELLSKLEIWDYPNFEKNVLESGETQRYFGILLILFSLVFLGTALFSSLIHIKNSAIIWLIGLMVLFAGIYFVFSAEGVSFFSESIVTNTAILGLSMMFYMLFLSISITYFLKRTKKIANLAIMILATANALFFLLPIISDVFFFDTWLWWVLVQIAVNTALAVCLVREFSITRAKKRWFFLSALLPLLSFAIDAAGIWLIPWSSGVLSPCVFILLFAVAIIMVLRLIPHSINAATKARKLEMEKIVLNAQLSETRISTMMSQIRPHFIYNTLGSIEQLCSVNPKKAGELVHNFSKYLRGNFGELDNPKPILMSQELAHVHHYISIENVRFPDMTFSFEMNANDFHIPALTIQPIVENAIKHGLMKLTKGGTVQVTSYETASAYHVSVVDDGVGFDTSALLDERTHIGLRNIRERLKVMVNGTLEIESTVGVGTKVLITIPKEEQE